MVGPQWLLLSNSAVETDTDIACAVGEVEQDWSERLVKTDCEPSCALTLALVDVRVLLDRPIPVLDRETVLEDQRMSAVWRRFERHGRHSTSPFFLFLCVEHQCLFVASMKLYSKILRDWYEWEVAWDLQAEAPSPIRLWGLLLADRPYAEGSM